MDIQESELLTKLSQNLYWKSSSGSMPIRELGQSHLVNCIGHATKSMQVAEANPDIPELNEYEGLNWSDWLMVFKHEYHRRAKEAAKASYPSILFNKQYTDNKYVEPAMVQPTNYGRRYGEATNSLDY